MQAAPASAEPFLLPAPGGGRFCLFHPPRGPARGALLYLHPFADEMNKTRRLAAQQARALAARGIGVLLLDLHGCGDSGGDFVDARWETWRADVALGRDWLEQRLGLRAGLWGARLGALLALDAAQAGPAPERLLLWQPVLSGAVALNQFLRLRVAGDMLADAGSGSGGGTRALRARLAAGSPLEVAGYELAPQLAAALEPLEAALLFPPCPVHWFEVGPGPAPSTQRVADTWRARGVALTLEQVDCAPFWATVELADCPQLLAATSAVYAEACDAV
jgi:exosortase A-associated hydrolase 2